MVTYQNILVGTDFSARADVAVEAAVELARSTEGARITLVHVLDTTLGGNALPYDLTGEERAAREEEALDAARDRLRETADTLTGVDVGVEVRRGHPAKELARAAVALKGDLIVTATQGYGAIKRAILGSVTTSLLGYASVPVLVVGEDRGPVSQPQRIMASVDLSPVSAHVLENAFALAGDRGGVRVVSVFDEPLLIAGDHPFSLQAYSLPARIRRLEDQRDAVQQLAEAVAPEGARYEVTTVPGSPPHLEVLELARTIDPDIIVVGASGHRTWSKALFGTNGARIIAGCHVPVLVVPDPTHRAAEAPSPKVESQASKTDPKEEIVYGTFDPSEVRDVLARIDASSIESDHISVVMSEETHAERFKDEDQADQGFIAGSAVGTAVGGVLGGLASLAVSTGIGLVVVGPAVALGLIGGLIGTLVGYGVPEHDAARLQEAVERGKVLIAIHARGEDELKRAKTLLTDAGAQPKRLYI
jgi:nucleotide-binding universal stress UspA family protein